VRHNALRLSNFAQTGIASDLITSCHCVGAEFSELLPICLIGNRALDFTRLSRELEMSKVDMKTPELRDVGWLGPRDEMDRASHRFGKCSECNEIICIEKAVADKDNTQQQTSEMLFKAFYSHVTLKHSGEASQPLPLKTA
jgi:hypothetical protein